MVAEEPTGSHEDPCRFQEEHEGSDQETTLAQQLAWSGPALDMNSCSFMSEYLYSILDDWNITCW